MSQDPAWISAVISRIIKSEQPPVLSTQRRPAIQKGKMVTIILSSLKRTGDAGTQEHQHTHTKTAA